jgi:hypothetical protein
VHQRYLATTCALVTAIAAVSLQGMTLAGQTAARPTPKTEKAWTPPRGPDGHADLSGVWSHNSATPLQRSQELAGRALLTDEEVAALKREAARLFGGGEGDAAFGEGVYLAALHNVLGKEKGFRMEGAGSYNSFWNVNREFENRTSLIVSPEDGRLPALTADAQKRRAAARERQKLHEFDGPEDVPLGHRCITGFVPMLDAGYNSYYQLFQTPAYVAIHMEMRHDARIVPIANRPHVPKNVRLWLGDPIGRWEGDTLVVDSANFRDDSPISISGVNATVTTHLVERLTRVGPDTLKYEVTVDDPSSWTKPWTALLFMKSTKDAIYEYACHEGNYAMENALRSARVEEQQR